MRIWGSVAACLLLLCGSGCTPQEATASVSGPGGGELTARRGRLGTRIVLTGELQAVESAKITVPRTPTWRLPIRWMEQDGATVVEGQKVLELENSQFTGELSQKRLSESQARNDLARKRADVAVAVSDAEFALEEKRIGLEKARVDASIPEELRAARDHQEAQLALARAGSEQEKAAQDLRSIRQASEADLEELRIALKRIREEVQTARVAIEALTLEAPRDGILVVGDLRRENRKFQVGDQVWVGLAVMRIPELTAMKVVAGLSDVDDGRIEAGMLASCTLDIAPEREFSGKVTEITPVAQEEGDDSLRRSFRVVIHLDESDPERMRPGMSVRAEIRPPPVEDVLIVPRSTVDWSDETPRVLLAGGSSEEVVLGPCSAQECVVESGLAEGARLRRNG